MTTSPSLMQSSGPLSPHQLWRTFRKRWPMVVLLTVAVSLTVTFNMLNQIKIYRSSATILIDPNPPRPLGKEVQTIVELGTGAYWSNVEYYETQFKIIQSRRLAEDVVRTLGLHRDAGFLLNLPPGKTAPPMEMTVQAAAGALRGRIQVDPIKSSRIVTVSMTDADPVRAQRLVTALIAAYIDQNVEETVASTNTATDWLQGQLDKLKSDLENGELALHGFKMDKNILSVSIDDQSNMLRGEMAKLSETLTDVLIREQHVSARRTELLTIDANDPTDLPVSELLVDSAMQTLRSSYVNSKMERDSLIAQGKGQSHPDVQAVEARMRAARDALMSEIRSVQGAIDRDLSGLKNEAASLSALLEASKKRALDLNLSEIEYKTLLRTKNNTEKLYSMVLDRTKESELTRMMKFNNIRVMDSALVPTRPENPRVGMMIALGTMGGLLLGLGLAVTRELLDRSLKTPDDIERELGTAFLGLLPQVGTDTSSGSYYRRRQRKRPNGRDRLDPTKGLTELIVHDHPASGIAEAARAIRTNLLFMAPDNPFRRLLVTSPAPSEGKTTVACCIAIAMAQAGQRVLLIDCDLRRPRIHRVFRRPNESGLTSSLLDRSVLDSSLLATEVPNLTILPSGPLAPNPAELLQSESFAHLLDELQARFDRVVLDSPPIVPVTDASVISRRVDGTVLVVRAFQTSRDLGRRAVRALRDLDSRIIGTVLNAVDLDRRGYNYYQYYYYKRYGDAKEPSAPAPQPGAPS